MKLGNPIKNFVTKSYPEGHVIQWFGENLPLYSKVCASAGVCLTGGHNGLDIVSPWGTPILAVSNQKVVEVKYNANGYGKHVRCLGQGYEYTYGHLSEIKCSLGQELKAGEVLGLMGNTGFVVSGATPFWEFNPYAGTHLHFGMRVFTSWVGSGSYNIQYQSGDRGTIEDYNNGFMGSIDSSLFFDVVPQTNTIELQLTVISLANQAILLLKQLIRLKQG